MIFDVPGSPGHGRAEPGSLQAGQAFLSGVVKVQVLQACRWPYPGELTLISGPSGCGKSTLLSLLSGLQHPDDGKAHALGRTWAP